MSRESQFKLRSFHLFLLRPPERSLTPFVLVQFGDEACFSRPQDVIAGEVHGSVEVADGQAEPQHAVGKVDGPLGSLQRLH